jgi:enoyl-CoA hydratase
MTNSAEPSSASPVVLVHHPEPAITVVTLNRPPTLNAMNASMIAALNTALDAASADASCRVIVLTGAGRGFCSGFDLGGYGPLPGDDARGKVQRDMAMQQDIARVIPRMRALPQPIIAAVNGPAAGGGMALALGADIRVAAKSARFNAAFVRLGLSATDIGVSWLLPRVVGAGRANQIMLTGRFVDADEAERIGLVTSVVPDDRLLDEAMLEARQIVALSPMGVRMTKEGLWRALEIPGLQGAIDLENRTQVMLLQTADHLEARDAFLNKRSPQFRDE